MYIFWRQLLQLLNQQYCWWIVSACCFSVVFLPSSATVLPFVEHPKSIHIHSSFMELIIAKCLWLRGFRGVYRNIILPARCFLSFSDVYFRFCVCCAFFSNTEKNLDVSTWVKKYVAQLSDTASAVVLNTMKETQVIKMRFWDRDEVCRISVSMVSVCIKRADRNSLSTMTGEQLS